VRLRQGLGWAGLLIVLASLLQAQPDPPALVQRLRHGIADYDKLVDELDLNRLPGDLLDYPLVSENLQRLGERLETLSHLAVELDRTPHADWTRLAEGVQLYENDLRQLRCQSLPLRVWGDADRRGRKQPDWGLAMDRTLKALPRVKGAFDAEATDTLELTLKPGDQQAAQIIVVPLTKDLRRVRAEVGDLKGPGGKLAAGQMTLRPVDYERLAKAEKPGADWWTWATVEGRPDVPLDLTQAFILTVTAPADLKAGEYRGMVRFEPAGLKALGLELRVTVPQPAG